jgi:4-amino-4-deoxy-L-arabinose transferase-like glycosyltransferase
MSSAAMWVAMGHFAALDMGLAFFLATAVFAFVAAQSGDQRDRSRLMRIAWAAAGLAVMSKGLIGVVLPGAAFVAYLAWTRDGSLLRRLHWASGLAIFALVTVPWFVLVAARNHEFLHFFFIHEHFERFTTTVHGRYEPPWYFIPVLAVGFFPFTLAIGHAIAAGLRRAPGVFQPERFLLAWCVVVFAFFSASSSKLPSYLLPILPALAVLAALGLERMSRGLRALQWLAFALCGAAVAIAAPLVTARPSSSIPADQLADYLPWLVASGVAFALGGAVAWGLERRMRALAATVVAGLGGLVGAQLALTGHESLSRTYSAYHVARAALPTLTPDTRLFAVDTYDHALPFYLRRTLTMVAYKDELAQAIAWEPEKFLPDYAAFRREWAASPRAMAFMDPREYETFAKEGLPMTLVARDEKRVIVAKP